MRPAGLAPLLPELGPHTPLRRLVSKLQAQRFVNPIGPLHVDLPPFTAMQHVHKAIAVAHTRLNDLLDASCKPSLIAAAGYIVIGRQGRLQGPVSPPDRYAPFTTKLRQQLTFASRFYRFRRMTSDPSSISRRRAVGPQAWRPETGDGHTLADDAAR